MADVEAAGIDDRPPSRSALALSALPFALPYLVLAILVNGSVQGGLHLFIPFFFAVALSDLLFGRRTANLDPATPESALILHHLLLWLWCPVQIGAFVFVLWQALVSGHLSALEIIAMTYIIGKSCVSGLTVGHELVHRPNKWERFLGELLLSSFAFSHYRTEHVYIHHARVGTPSDPVFARKGQSAWAFLGRAMFGSLIGSWQFEQDRLVKRGFSPWHGSNPFWRYGSLTLMWLVLVWFLGEAGPFGGWVGIALYLSYSAVANMILRFADYVEHYGLSRKILESGRYERVEPRHSWNASHRMSNWATWNVQRHSDHHHRPIRPYPLLQHYDTDVAPQLPSNYTAMFMVAMVPPLWRRLIDPLVDEWRARFYPEIESWRPYESKLYLARRDKLPLISEIMEASPRLGDWVEGRPDLLDSLDRQEFADLSVPDDIGIDVDDLKIARRGMVRLYYMREFDYGELGAQTIDSEEPLEIEDNVDVARDWMNTRVFQAAMHLLRGNLEPSLFGRTLSGIMDAAIDVLLQSHETKFGEDRSSLLGGKCAVIAFGDLGRCELSLDSTLDLILVHDGSDADGRVDQAFRGLAARLFRSIAALGRQNLLFERVVSSWDGGDEGITTLSMSAFESRFADGDVFASYLALVDARAVCGDEDVVELFNDRRRELLSGWAGKTDWKPQLAGLRAGLEAPSSEETGVASLNALKRAPGGISDLRLMAAYAVLLSVAADALPAEAESESDPFTAAGLCGALDADVAKELAAANSLWRNLDVVLPLTNSRRQPDHPHTTAMEAVIVSACGAESFSRLAEEAQESRQMASARINRLLDAD